MISATSTEGKHADTLGRIRSLTAIIDTEWVAGAFVASLGSRSLATRSALGSYACARVLPDHPLIPMPNTYATICGVCGWSQLPAGEEAREALNANQLVIERQKYGGLRHWNPEYAAYDLEMFRTTPRALPTADDWHRLDLILRTVALLAPDAKAADLGRAIQSVLPSNKNERMTLIQILGYIGVIEVTDHPSFFDEYIPAISRDLPHQRFADWGYPIIWWRARHGIRLDAVAHWFPESALVRDG